MQTLKQKCQRLWQQLNIPDIDSLKSAINAIFEVNTNQGDALVGIYRLVFPEWDDIELIKGFPEAGNELWKHICRCFIEFDRKHHPDVFPGGIWMNTGFSSNPKLESWEISFDNCSVVYMAEYA